MQESGKELEDRAKSIESQNINKLVGGEEDDLLEGYVMQSVNDKSLAMV